MNVTPVGTITLCGICHRAIRLVQHWYRDADDKRRRSYPVWRHMSRSLAATPHDPELPRLMEHNQPLLWGQATMGGGCPSCGEAMETYQCSSCGYGA